MKRLVSFFVLISGLMLGLSSCDKGGDEDMDPVEIDMEALNNARMNWERLNIKDYTFDCSFNERGEYPYTVVVRNGIVQQITPEPNDPYVFEYLKIFTGRNLTMDNLFLEIEKLSKDPYIKVSGRDVFCFEAEINYDATYYYPKYLQLSYGASGKDEYGEYFDVAPDIFIIITRFKAD